MNRAVTLAEARPSRWTPRGAVAARFLSRDSTTYRITLNGRTFARGTAAPNEEVVVHASPPERGWLAGTVELEPDELAGRQRAPLRGLDRPGARRERVAGRRTVRQERGRRAASRRSASSTGSDIARRDRRRADDAPGADHRAERSRAARRGESRARARWAFRGVSARDAPAKPPVRGAGLRRRERDARATISSRRPAPSAETLAVVGRRRVDRRRAALRDRRLAARRPTRRTFPCARRSCRGLAACSPSGSSASRGR